MKLLRRVLSPSLRYKLLLLVLFPILVVVPTVVALGVYWSKNFAYEQLFRKVTTDLSVAHDVFARVQQDYVTELRSLSRSHSFYTAFAAQDADTIRDQLAALKQTVGFDFLHLTDLQGRWLHSENKQVGWSKLSPLREDAGLWGVPSVGVEVFDFDDLVSEGDALLDATLADVSGPADGLRAMVIRTVVPVRDLNGTIVALLDGGVLVNRNFRVVDTIRDLVYGAGTLPDGSHGAVSVFLGDERISTNLPRGTEQTSRGTKVPAEVHKQVVASGSAWVDRLHTVNGWYIAAIEPIIDVYGRRVGMLSTGFLEKPVRDTYIGTIAILVVVLLIGVMLAVSLAIIGAKSIFRPVEEMAAVVRATQRGKRERIGVIDSGDEIGELARQFDEMLDLLEQRNKQVQLAADKLETKVEERTEELRENNERLREAIAQLLETRRQLVEAEKLAALGELTAGVAHEINNPIAVILGNIEVLREVLRDHSDSIDTEVELIIDQVYRIRAIVDKLLRYARPSDYAGVLETIDVNDAVEHSLLLVKHELESKGAHIQRRYEGAGTISIDRQELHQVMVNLLINAARAIRYGGHVEVCTEAWASDGVVVYVKDDGVGISPHNIERIFDPFFTTQNTGGNGLGLSVSYGIVRRYGGDIKVESREGHGACFRVYLPRRPAILPDTGAAVSRATLSEAIEIDERGNL